MPISDNICRGAAEFGLVSIVMPNYNGAPYIRETVESVLAQNYENWELLFVDDCSTDNSMEIIRSFSDERIHIFSTGTNSGAARARNVAIEKATGKYIAFLDSDDLWLPEKLSRQLAFMEENRYVFTFGEYKVIDETGKQVARYCPRLDSCTYKDVLRHNYIGCLTAIYNAEALGKVYMPEDAVKREDVACWLAILKKTERAYCLHEILAHYKLHAGSVSSNKLKMMKYQWDTYRKVEKIGVFQSAYYLMCWAILGVLKYR